MSVNDLWCGMVSHKSHVSELKNWMPRHSKKKKKPRVGVELRVGGDPHRFEKLGWSAGDTRQWPKKKKIHRHPVSPMGVLLLVSLTCLKSAKELICFCLFKVSKITSKFLTCSNSAK